MSDVSTIAPRNPLRPAAQATYEKIFSTVYVGLMVNVFLAAAVSPLLVALAIVREPLAAWPFFAVLSCLCAPALVGAFACFAALGEDEARPVVLRPFWSAYRRSFLRGIGVWAIAAVLVSVLALDGVVLAGTSLGVVLVPFFVVASALAAMTLLAVLVMLAADPTAQVRSLVRPSLYLVVRKVYLALPGLLAVGLAAAVVLLQPVLGLMLACSPLLYVAWANLRYVVAPMLP